MFELPRRENELVVEVESGAVKLYMRPLNDETYFRINESSKTETEGEKETVVFRASRIPGLFEDHLLRVEGATVEGQPFNTSDPAHLARIRQSWKGIAVARLIRYGLGLDSAMGNVSRPREESSPVAATPTPDLTPESAGS